MNGSTLDPLLADGVIDEIVGRLKSGKEADIWLVRREGALIAAKVYKDRDRRSFKNNAEYKEGRAVRNSRTQRAIDRGSSFGREEAEQAWKTAEADALNALHAAGVRVPRPIRFIDGVLLMEVVAGADGEPAPRLIDVPHLGGRAREMYRDLRGQMIRMLCAEIIHGDLSAYNILAAANGPTIIDFPQVVSPSHNSRAEYFFLRDFQNVLQFLGSHDRGVLEFADDGRKIWSAYVRRHLTPDFRPSPPGSDPRGPRPGPPRDAGSARGPQPHPHPHPHSHGQPPHGQPPRPQPKGPPRGGKVPSWQPPPAPPPRPIAAPPSPHAPDRPPHAGAAPNGDRRGRRRRRRGGRGGGPPPPHAPHSGGAPATAAPRPHGHAHQPHGKPPAPPAAPKLPSWLVNASKRGGSGPRPKNPADKKPFRRRKRRF